MVFQAHQRFFVIADQHALAWGKVHRYRELRFRHNLQSIQFCFAAYVLIFGCIGDKGVFVISKDGKSVFAGFLFKIRQHFGVYPALKQEFSVLGIDNLPTVIGEDEASVVAQFQSFCNRHKAIRRSAGSQHDTHAHLLHLQQGGQRALTDFLFTIEQGSVHIKN